MSKYNRFEKHRVQKKQEKEKKKMKKRFFLKSIILGILLVAIVGTGIYVVMQNTQFFNKEEKLIVNPRLNFLVSGVDGLKKGVNRADSIMIVSVDLKTNKVGILSLPRDTRVKIPGKEGHHKLNAAYAYGGPKLLQDTVEKSLKVPIDYYVSTDFNGFRDIINTLGGVQIDVAERLKYIDQAGGLYIDIPPGKQTLYGQKALEYIRFRHDELGDIGRIQRQQKFLSALMEKVSNLGVLLKVPQLSKHLINNIETNLPMTEGFKLVTKIADYLKDADKNEIKMKTLPGEPKYFNGVSYWVPDRQEARVVVSNLIRSKDYLNNSDFKVAVLNGTGKENVAEEVGDLLSQSGYEIVKVGNADNFNYSRTQILFRPELESEAKELADYLDGKLISWEETNLKQESQDKADIKIILGKNSNQI